MGIEVAGDTELRTPLHNTHVKYRGKIMPFTGYLLPVQYDTGVIAEHMAVRTKYGLFDVLHIGEIICRDSDAQKNLSMILTNNYTVMADGQAHYSPMCNENDGVVDDLIVYKVRDNCCFIVVNAVDKDKDSQWMKTHQLGDVEFEDVPDRVVQLVLRGPKAMEVLRKLAKKEDISEKYYTCLFDCMIGNIKCIISKTGYTGGDGVEVYLAPENTPTMWEMLTETGQEKRLILYGLGAGDTLQLEASMPLCRREMNDAISPKEAGLGIFVKTGKEDLTGKQVLMNKGPLTRGRIGSKVTGQGVIREHQVVYADGRQIEITTSDAHCPYLGYLVAMVLVDVEYKGPGTVLEVEIRGRQVAAEVVKLLFYKRWALYSKRY